MKQGWLFPAGSVFIFEKLFGKGSIPQPPWSQGGTISLRKLIPLTEAVFFIAVTQIRLNKKFYWSDWKRTLLCT